jgi:hypothetical protein
MKTLCTLLAAALLAGCSDQSAQQQAEINRLRADVDRQQQTITNLVGAIDRFADRVTKDGGQLTAALERWGSSEAEFKQETLDWLGNLQDRIRALEQRTNYVVVPKLPPPAYSGTPRIRTAPETKPAQPRSQLQGGIPDEVYAQIEREAIRRYPVDFGMQEFVIKKEVESWKRVNP